MALQITVDHNRCVGTRMCTLVAEQVFELDPAGQSVVKPGVTGPLEAAMEGAENCPMEAITVVDTASGETLFP